MAQDNAALLQTIVDNLTLELKNHTADRLLGKERTSYTLNGRSFDWLGYQKAIMEMIKDAKMLLAGETITVATVRVR